MRVRQTLLSALILLCLIGAVIVASLNAPPLADGRDEPGPALAHFGGLSLSASDIDLLIVLTNQADESARLLVNVAAEAGGPLEDWFRGLFLFHDGVPVFQKWNAQVGFERAIAGVSYGGHAFESPGALNDLHPIVGDIRPPAPMYEEFELKPGRYHLLVALSAVAAKVELTPADEQAKRLVVESLGEDPDWVRFLATSTPGAWEQIETEARIGPLCCLMHASTTLTIRNNWTYAWLVTGAQYVDLKLEDAAGKQCRSSGPSFPLPPPIDTARGLITLFDLAPGLLSAEGTSIGRFPDLHLFVMDLPIPASLEAACGNG
jgi:hypothetical protein